MKKNAKNNIRAYTTKKDLIGTEKEIINELRKFCTCESGIFYIHGMLLKFVSSTSHTPYIFNKENENKLLLRKRSNCYMIPGDCGQIDIDKYKPHIFKVEEVCEDMWKIDIKKLLNIYNINISPKEQHKYY